MAERMTLATFIRRFDAGDFLSENCNVQIEAGWYDWFCRDSSLVKKTKTLGEKVKQIAKSPLIDAEKTYVFFKNNCPMRGPLYDDFRICDLETGDVIFTIIPRCSHSGKAEIWGRQNDFDGPIVQGTWRDVRKFFVV